MVVHFALLLIILLLLGCKCKEGYRENIFLPISVILLGLYWMLMYDYGLDYWSYYQILNYDPHYGDEKGEPFFWNLFYASPNYFLFVGFYAIVVSCSIYYLVKNNISPNYYAFFFLIYLLHPSLCLNMTYVFRSAMGSCIVWFALSRFYVWKVNYIYLYILFAIAALFHHSLALCFLLPIACYFLEKIPGPLIFASLIGALFLGVTQSMELFVSLIGGMDSFEEYAHYGEERIKDASFVMIASRALHLIPAYVILYYRGTNEYTKRLSGICMFYYMVYFMGFDMLGRLTMMLYVFVIICIVMMAENKGWIQKMLLLFPSFLFAAYRNVMFYLEMASSYEGDPGNMLEYKSIFSIIF